MHFKLVHSEEKKKDFEMSMGQLTELLGDNAYDISYLNSTMKKIFPFLDVTKDDRLILRWKDFIRYLRFGTD